MGKKQLRFLKMFEEDLLKGRKTSTLRKGKIEIFEEGEEVEVLAGKKKIGRAIIKKISFVKFKEIGKEEAEQDGFKSRRKLKRMLKRIYGKVSREDEFTKIEFEMKEE